jgi:TRAP-type C4-dicarboxylate transport system permease small subunit
MQIEQLIELVYWILIIFGVLVVLVFIASVIIIYKVSKNAELEHDEELKSPYKYPYHTITHYSTQRSKK